MYSNGGVVCINPHVSDDRFLTKPHNCFYVETRILRAEGRGGPVSMLGLLHTVKNKELLRTQEILMPRWSGFAVGEHWESSLEPWALECRSEI